MKYFKIFIPLLFLFLLVSPALAHHNEFLHDGETIWDNKEFLSLNCSSSSNVVIVYNPVNLYPDGSYHCDLIPTFSMWSDIIAGVEHTTNSAFMVETLNLTDCDSDETYLDCLANGNAVGYGELIVYENEPILPAGAMPTATVTLSTLGTVVINTGVSTATTVFQTYWPYILILGVLISLVIFVKLVIKSGHKMSDKDIKRYERKFGERYR